MRILRSPSQPLLVKRPAAFPIVTLGSVALALVSAVIGGTIASRDDGGTFGAVVHASVDGSGRERPKDMALPQRLETIREEVGIRPEQEPAWRRFVGSMEELDVLTRRFERRVASGAAVDETSERARHALLYGSSMNDIEGNLSSVQASIFRRISAGLATSAVCRRLAGR